MKLHYETISQDLFRILQQLQASELLKDFRLVGGTSLSLQRGHRKSVDIDLFTDKEYDSMPTQDLRRFIDSTFPYSLDTDSFEKRALGYSVRLAANVHSFIKCDFFYTEKFLFPAIEQDGLRLADERDIAAMKMLAIGNGSKRQKDYWDIHELMQSYSIEDMIFWCLRMNQYTLNEQDIIRGLEMVDSVEASKEGIITMNPYDFWELKVEEIKEATKDYKSSRIPGDPISIIRCSSDYSTLQVIENGEYLEKNLSAIDAIKLRKTKSENKASFLYELAHLPEYCKEKELSQGHSL